MKLVVLAEDNSNVVDDNNVVMFSGTREECVMFIANKIDENIIKMKSREKNGIKS